MRLPFTDKFLWDMYNILEKASDLYAFSTPPTMKEAFCPGLHKLRYEYEKKQNRKHFDQFIYYLKKKGYIKIRNLENKSGILLTKKGTEKALKARLKIEKKKKRKDGKWQMIIFDIPERKRGLRDIFRDNLLFLGYKMFQQSVWVCPYDVLKETEKIIREYSLDKYVRLFLIEEIET